MSQIIEYFRSLFRPRNSPRGKRKREYSNEEPQYPIKYRRVSNHFPKSYSRPIEDESDLFAEVNRQRPQYNELLQTFLMDQNRKQAKSILEDGEFSDEDDSDSIRVPAQQRRPKEPAFQFNLSSRIQQPSTSSAFHRSTQHRSYAAFGDDNDVQYVSTSRSQPRSPRNDVPPLIPIGGASSSQMVNGHSTSDRRSISVQPPRGRKSSLGFGNRFMAFNNSPPPSHHQPNSILNQQTNMDVKKRYDSLLRSLIPRFPTGMFKGSAKTSKQPIQTIDLSEDVEEPRQHQQHERRRFSFNDNLKKPSTYIDLSDDDDEPANFTQNHILSSTMNTADKRRTTSFINQSRRSELLPEIKPINSLQEKQASIRACQPDVIDSIVRKFNESRELKDRVILEEKRKAEQLEHERMQHERENQKRIDEAVISALADKCIIIDEEEEVVDEFPPLKDEHMRVVNYALYGPRQEVIVSKFKMDVTRYDLATLDGLNWLNDMVINFYLELIKERSEQVEYLPKVHVMNTCFLGKLLESGYQSVRRWTRKVDIFSYDIIPVPVHVGGVHWCMSIIHLKNKSIKYYDSMGHPNYMVLEALENYLKEESMDKRKIPFDTSDWTMECVRDCPQQKNGSDCGVFSCQFAEFISRDSAISFEQQHMPYIRRKMIYEIAKGKLMLGF